MATLPVTDRLGIVRHVDVDGAEALIRAWTRRQRNMGWLTPEQEHALDELASDIGGSAARHAEAS